jgi:iturin family lipopeptide synthetase B
MNSIRGMMSDEGKAKVAEQIAQLWGKLNHFNVKIVGVNYDFVINLGYEDTAALMVNAAEIANPSTFKGISYLELDFDKNEFLWFVDALKDNMEEHLQELGYHVQMMEEKPVLGFLRSAHEPAAMLAPATHSNNLQIPEMVLELVPQVFGVDKVSPDTQLRTLYKDPITAIYHLKLELKLKGIELSNAFSHQNKTIRDLIANCTWNDDDSLEPNASSSEFTLCTPQQAGMLAFLASDKSKFIIQDLWEMTGDVSVQKLVASWKVVAENHESLRSVFTEIHGKFYQKICSQDITEWTFAQFQDEQEALKWAEAQMQLERSKGFAIDSKSFVRMSMGEIVGTNSRRIIMCLTIHHCITDGWSNSVIFNDLLRVYNGLAIPKAIRSHPSPIEKESLESQKYWKDRFKDFSPSFLPYSFSRSDLIGVTKSWSTVFEMNNDRASKLRRELSISNYAFFQAALAIMIAKYTRNFDVTFGGICSGRNHEIVGIDRSCGFFVNTTPIRVILDSSMVGDELLQLCHQQYQCQQPYLRDTTKEIRYWISASSNEPLFNVLLTYQKFLGVMHPRDSVITAKNTKHYTADTEQPISFVIWPKGGHYVLEVKYDCNKFSLEMVQTLALNFIDTVHSLVEENHLPISIARLLGPGKEERAKLINFGRGTSVSITETVDTLFQVQVKQNPSLIAVRQGTQSITYAELNRKAESLASYLIKEGVVVGDIIGLVSIRSIDFIIGLLGILKAGAAYLPLDSSLPKERISYMVTTANCKMVLHHSRSFDSVEGLSAPLVSLSVVEEKETSFIPVAPSPISAAYVIFTSGSTGKPKGIVLEHLALVNYIKDYGSQIEVKPGMKVAQVASISFDACVSDVFTALCYGAELVLRDEFDFFQVLRVANIAMITPTALSKLDPSEFTNLKSVILAGEMVPPLLVEKWAKRCQLWNAYGPSEITVASSFGRLTDANLIHTGKPVANTLQYIVDDNMQLVPHGVAGQLVIGGIGVAKGYLGRPDLTAERFIDNHFEKDGSKMYLTGDTCRWTENGEIQILGRTDEMVKVKGYRVELEEVSDVISRCTEVSGCVALVKEDMLVAFVSPSTVNVQKVREFALQHLPHFMIPAVFVPLEEIPMNSNGKADKKLLKTMEVEFKFEEITTEEEKLLAQIWASVLKVDITKIGRQSSFFELGGDSISAIQIVSECAARNIFLSTSDIFKYQTISQLLENSTTNDIQVQNVSYSVE